MFKTPTSKLLLLIAVILAVALLVYLKMNNISDIKSTPPEDLNESYCFELKDENSCQSNTSCYWSIYEGGGSSCFNK